MGKEHSMQWEWQVQRPEAGKSILSWRNQEKPGKPGERMRGRGRQVPDHTGTVGHGEESGSYFKDNGKWVLKLCLCAELDRNAAS